MSSTESPVPEAAPPIAAHVEPERESGLTLLGALLAIRRQMYLVVICAALGAAVGGLIGLSQPTVFSSTAMLTVRPTSPDLQLQMPPLAGSYAALAKTDAVAARFRAATGTNLPDNQLLDRVTVSNSSVTPDLFLTAQANDAESSHEIASAWTQALIAQVDSTKGTTSPGGDLVVLAPASQGTLTSSPSILKSAIIGLCAGLLLGLATALAVDAIRQRGSRAAVAARRGVPVIFVSRGHTSPSALDDGARIVLAMLHPASAGPGRLVVIDIRNGPAQGAAADAIARTLASQGVPATVLRSARRKIPAGAGTQAEDGIPAATPSALRSVPGVTVLPIERSSSPARWALSAAGRKEIADISTSQQVIINVPFDVSRSDALAVSARAPGVIVVAGPGTRAKDLDEALALLTAVAPARLVVMIVEGRRARRLVGRLASQRPAVTAGEATEPAPTQSGLRRRTQAEPPPPASVDSVGDRLTSSQQ